MDKIFRNCFLVLTISLCGYRCAPSYCPKYCQCDSYKNLNRADCSAHKLISPTINIPKNVEILDLSENAITTLDNNCFEDLFHLLNLTISYNNIHTIYLDAFSPLEKIQFIDLSNNRLEYFDQRIFENNKKLSSLNLSGNKFMLLQNKPLLNSISLQYLSLRNSQITHIYTALFEGLPSLLKIDLSDNLLITITSAPFNTLRQLKFVNLEGNPWTCDGSTETTFKVLKRKNVDVRMGKCKFESKRTKQMFERMVMMPKETPTTTERSQTNVEFVWKNWSILNNTDAARCSRYDILETCRLYTQCMTNYKNLLHKTNSQENPSPIKFSSGIHVEDFCVGFILGVLSTSLPVLGIYFIRKICFHKKREYVYLATARSRRRNRGTNNQSYRTTEPLPRIPPALHRSLSTPERRARDPNQGDFTTFVSGLFERPRRRQYCRAINQTTADVIRRISRSNLLIASRLSQHFGDNRNFSQETEQLINISGPNESRESENNRQRRQGGENLVINRPETPPPEYKDVVSTNFI